MNRRIRRVGQRCAVFGKDIQIGLQRLRINGDCSGAGAKLCGIGGVGVFPAEHQIRFVLAQSRAAPGPVRAGNVGNLDVSGINIVAAGADAAVLRSIQNFLRPMKPLRQRELIGEIHGLCNILAVGGGRIRISVQLDVPDKAALGSDLAVRADNASGRRAVQSFFQRIRIALRFPERVDLFFRRTNRCFICCLCGCQNFAPDGKSSACAGG